MKYQIKKLEINNFAVYEQNKLKGRSYFIPYSDKKKLMKTSVLEQRFNSSLVTVLSGEWQFKYFEKISRLPANIDTDKMSFDTVRVPSTWQRTGYEKPVYLNTRYEFPMTLPVVPDEMSAAVYVKKFNVSDISKNIIITFLGVCSSLTLYVNGKYVGYSEGSHNSAEFNLNGLVKDGENELLAIVSKWTKGTYLECQDMFRENGIFRDVYITENPANYINDFKINTRQTDGGYELSVDVETVCKVKGLILTAELYDGGKLIAEKTASAEEGKIGFGVLDVRTWTAETPELYDLVLSFGEKDEKEYIRSRIGFRTVRIEGERFLFNSKLIKFKGVNHHDTHEKTGYVMSPEDLLKDIRLMKEFNVNTVRTSHYPPDPIFLDLCDEYGLYVVDEADIETHGTQSDLDNNFVLKPNIISNDKKWLPRYEDRVMRMYDRDKNHVSITMWSLGNESGGWKNQDACYARLKEVSDLPVHYEAVIKTPRGSYDVISEMYQHIPVIEKIAQHKATSRYRNKPYFLCEYCHAMGVGPGSLEDYWQLIYANENLTGGCIWEWADHSVYDKKAKYKYTYGGDHGEKYHDGNFCVDGLFYPDRTPHTGAYEMKAVYRPVRAALVSEGVYRFRNTNSFIDTSDLIITYELIEDGVKTQLGSVDINVPALEEREINLNHKSVDKDKDTHITFIYEDKKGNIVAKEQLTLNETVKEAEPDRSGKPVVTKKKDKIYVAFENGEAVFSSTKGNLISYSLDGKAVFADTEGLRLNIYRAFLDNDRNIVNGWKSKGYNEMEAKFRSLSTKEKDGYVEIESKYDIILKDKTRFEYEGEYKIYSDGTIAFEAELKKKGISLKATELPRFGANIRVDSRLKNVEYYGLGELENLPDFDAQSIIGIFSSDVAGLDVPYIRPQDNGNHGRCRYMKLTDEKGKGIEFINKDDYFSFSVHQYSDELLEKAKHLEDIKDEGFINVNIDGFIRGTGSNSCGPNTLGKYRFAFKKETEFGFYIKPVR